MFTQFSQHISQTQAKISKVQNRLLQNSGDDDRTTLTAELKALSALVEVKGDITPTTNNQKNKELEQEKRDMISSFSAEKQRYEEEIVCLKEQIYTIRAQLISNSSNSYKKSMDAMRERRTKVRLYSPTSVATDLDASSAYDDDCPDYYASMNSHHRQSKSVTTQTLSSSSSVAEDEEVETLKRQLMMAKKETEAANEASREILRRYALEMTSAKNDLINAQQQITQLEVALETHEIKSNERLTQAQGDIILLQVGESFSTTFFHHFIFYVSYKSFSSSSDFIIPLSFFPVTV